MVSVSTSRVENALCNLKLNCVYPGESGHCELQRSISQLSLGSFGRAMRACGLSMPNSAHLSNVQLFSHLIDETHVDHLVIGNGLFENSGFAHDGLSGYPGFLRDESVRAVDAIGKAPIERGLEVILSGGWKFRLGEIEHLRPMCVGIDEGADNRLDEALHCGAILFNHVAAHAQCGIDKRTEFLSRIEDRLGPEAGLVEL